MLNNIDIPERVRSFAPKIENRVKSLTSNELLINAGISTSRSKSDRNKGIADQSIGAGLHNGGFTIRNRPTVQREFELEKFSDFSESVSENPKKSGIKTTHNNFSQEFFYDYCDLLMIFQNNTMLHNKFRKIENLFLRECY